MESYEEVLSESSRFSLSLSNPNDSTNLGKQVTIGSGSRKDNDDANSLAYESDGEDGVVWEDDVGEEEEKKLALGLIGRIWTKRTVNPNAFMSTIKNIWALKHGIKTSNIGKNKYLFQFHHWRDKRKVVEGQPWHFDHYAILLGELGEIEKPSEAVLFRLPIWVRFYDVPFKGRYNEGNAMILGNKVGEFLMHDKREMLGMEKSMRIRVLLDVRKPLKKLINLKMRGGFSNRISVKYESLSLFCFFCGRLAHGTKDCDDHHGEGSPVKIFNGGLKASPWRSVREQFEGEGDAGNSFCARNLFVAKPKSLPLSSPIKDKVDSVVKMLDKVDLSTHEKNDIVTWTCRGRWDRNTS